MTDPETERIVNRYVRDLERHTDVSEEFTSELLDDLKEALENADPEKLEEERDYFRDWFQELGQQINEYQRGNIREDKLRREVTRLRRELPEEQEESRRGVLRYLAAGAGLVLAGRAANELWDEDYQGVPPSDNGGGSEDPSAPRSGDSLSLPDITNYVANSDIDPRFWQNQDALYNLGDHLRMENCADISGFGKALYDIVDPQVDAGGDEGDYKLRRWEFDSSMIEDSELSETVESSDLHGLMYLTDEGGRVQDRAYVGLHSDEYDNVESLFSDDIVPYLNGESGATPPQDWRSVCD